MNTNNESSSPFAESYWVIPGRFLAGEHPGAAGEKVLQKRIQALLRTGVNIYYDLTENLDGRRNYANLLYSEAIEYEMNVEYHNFPLEDLKAPSIETVKVILNSIDQNLAAQKIIYIHCYAGIGRTGTIVGCYLARHGISGLAALNELANLRQNLPSWYHRSPEMPDQVELVTGWPEGR